MYTGRLVAFDPNGETIRWTEVRIWRITDAGPDEDEEGLYISLNSSDDDNEIGSGISITADQLAACGFHAEPTFNEETAIQHGYIKVF